MVVNLVLISNCIILLLCDFMCKLPHSVASQARALGPLGLFECQEENGPFSGHQHLNAALLGIHRCWMVSCARV